VELGNSILSRIDADEHGGEEALAALIELAPALDEDLLIYGVAFAQLQRTRPVTATRLDPRGVIVKTVAEGEVAEWS